MDFRCAAAQPSGSYFEAFLPLAPPFATCIGDARDNDSYTLPWVDRWIRMQAR